jgi:putative tricarboxylic transport membrane protein
MPVTSRLRAVAPYLVVLAVSAALFWRAAGFTYARVGDRPGPEVWPRAILVLLMLTCAVRIARVLWTRRAAPVTAGAHAMRASGAPGVAPASADEAGATVAAHPEATAGVVTGTRVGAPAVTPPGDAAAGLDTETTDEPDLPRAPARLIAGIVATVLYVLLLPVLGFALGTALYIATMCRVGNYRRWSVIVPTALVGALAFMFVFQRIVYVSLPIGTPPFDAVALGLMRVMGIH